MTRPDAATEALAGLLASMDGKAKEFRKAKRSRSYEVITAYYEGYMIDAAEMRKRLERRGYVIRKARKSG